MLIVITGFGLLLIAIAILFTSSYAFYEKHLYGNDPEQKTLLYKIGRGPGSSDASAYLYALGGIITVIALIATLCLGVEYSQVRIVDDRIALYEQQNEDIEAEIAAIVSAYQAYEQDTFDKVGENISPTMVFALYPELKSDTLVAKQIELYVANNKTITELKASKFYYELYRWWICF
jgi:hypothetical protein